MKRGKEEEKRLEPMFPRLHVKDAEKGGPRAPPRNKMALYEQLSIPSQRFTSSDRAGSLPRNTSSPLLPPGPSSNQVLLLLFGVLHLYMQLLPLCYFLGLSLNDSIAKIHIFYSSVNDSY